MHEGPEVEDLETLETDTLMARYKESVGINPEYRSFDRDTVVNGIKDPEAERQRIAEIDRASDKEELNPRG